MQIEIEIEMMKKHFHTKFRLYGYYSGKLLSEFKKIPNLSMQFYTKPSKACSFMQNFSSLACTQKDLDTFLKKISGFFRKNFLANS
jgi:subtilase family serine protease